MSLCCLICTVGLSVRGQDLYLCSALYLFFYLFFFWLHPAACGILVPRPGVDPGPPGAEARSLNHWTQGSPSVLYLVELEQGQYKGISICRTRNLRKITLEKIKWTQFLEGSTFNSPGSGEERTSITDSTPTFFLLLPLLLPSILFTNLFRIHLCLLMWSSHYSPNTRAILGSWLLNKILELNFSSPCP